MPGTVISVPAPNGSTVNAGDTVVIVEAMKMEHKLTAGVAGTVSISVMPGDLVKLDQVVATLTPELAPETLTPRPTVEGDTA
jgi:acetyl-CoA/propionyl-CoA carboxylase biotin carboxyl carrier protein